MAASLCALNHSPRPPCCRRLTQGRAQDIPHRGRGWCVATRSDTLHALTHSLQHAMAESNSSSRTAQEAEYMQLYRDMQRQAEANAAAAGGNAVAAAPMPTPEAFVAALSSASAAAAASSADGDESDDDSDDGGESDRRGFVFPGLSLSPSALLSFRLTSWHPVLRRHTIPTRFIPLPTDFVDYLLEDGVWIPEELAPVRPGHFVGRDSAHETAAERRAEAAKWRATIEELHDSDDEAEEAAEAAAEAKQLARQCQPFFPELVGQLQLAIGALGGEAFPSLDWHAPTDASWISTERVAKCQTVGDILLLLKSSDKVQEEIADPFVKCSKPAEEEANATAASSDASAAASSSSSSAAAVVASFTPTLALRKWSTLHPSKLFRCWLWRGSLLAISQIDANFYEFLQGESERDELQDTIEGWLEDEEIASKLSQSLGVEHAVMDLYIDLQERVWLVKLKPFWPAHTDSLLFSWKEIHQLTVAHDQQLKAKAEAKEESHVAVAAAAPAAPAAVPIAASASSGFDLPASWPSSASLSVPFRVISSTGGGLDVLRTVSNMKARFPADGFDVSDGEAIERWIQRVEKGDLKQK